MKHSRSCSTISHTIYPLIIDNEHTKLYLTITFPPKTHKRISPVHPQRPPFSLPWDSWILGRKDIGRYRLGESHDVLSHLREKPTIDQVNCRGISFHERREEHWRLREGADATNCSFVVKLVTSIKLPMFENCGNGFG